jgi:serine/threonine protein kinase
MNYVILRTLERGSRTKIKLVKETLFNQYYVIKFFCYDPNSIYPENEFNFLKNLDHPHIIKTFGFYHDEKSNYLILEYADHGDFFSLVKKCGKFSENLTRYFCSQLLKAIIYLKSLKISHRDLKLENLLLDKNLNLRLSDFEYSTQITEKKNGTRIGTKAYMCPELHYKKKYDLEKNDAFAFGIILFIMMVGHPPFHNAHHQDKYYVMFNKNRNQFWAIHSHLSGIELSQNFKNLIENLFEYDPEKRFDFNMINQSEFFQIKPDQNLALCEIKRFI